MYVIIAEMRLPNGTENVPLAEIAGVTLYRDDSVAEDEFYTYAVTAVDAAGNESEKSQAINASAMMPEILRMTPEENARVGGEKQILKVYSGVLKE